MKDSEVIRMGYSIQVYLQQEGVKSAKPRDLMPWLIRQGYFESDHREGLPLRNLLRKLDEENKLYLLPNIEVERKAKNRYWSFVRIDNYSK